MSKKLITILISVFAVLIVAGVSVYFAFFAASSLNGYVYDEATKQPIENVSVTDGRNVVKTDKDGAYKLDGFRKYKFVTITVPSGYTAKQYYQPLEKGKKSYDFYLNEDKTDKSSHTFLQISDTEINENGTGEWLGHIKSIIKETNPAFLIHTGDICYTEGLKKHIVDMNTETMGTEVKYIIGNHDYVDGKYGEELFESIYGPVWYSFEVGNVHYVVTPINFGDVKSKYNKNDRWKWLINDLENTDSNKEVVIFNHTNSTDVGLEDYTVKLGKNTFDLKEHNLKAWLFGHYHYNFVNENNGVLDISTARPDCGGIDQSVSGTRQITVAKDGSISTKMFYYDFDADNTKAVDSVWTSQLKTNTLFCDPIVVGDKVYVGTSDDDFPRECGIYCLNAETGETIWEYKTNNSIKNNFVLYENTIIAQDCHGEVYCVNAENGKKIWTYSQEIKMPNYTTSGMAIDSNDVYVGGGSEVTKLDAKTGKFIWKSATKSGEGTPAEMIVTKDKVIMSAQWNSLYAVDKKTGKEIWENKDEKLRFRSSTPAILDNGNILVATVDSVITVDQKDGKILDKTILDGYKFDVASKPLVEKNVAYITTAKNGIIAYDLKAKKVIWNFETKEALVFTSPYVSKGAMIVEGDIISDGENVVFGANDGYVYVVNKADGTLVKEVEIGAPILNSVAKYNNSVIVSDFSAKVTRVDV